MFIRLYFALWVGLACATLSGCGSTECQPISVTPTGDIARDLIGTWDGSGIDSRIVYVFEQGGRYRWLEPPNRYAPSGLQAEGTFVVTGDRIDLTQGGTISWWVEIGATTMKTYTSDPHGAGDPPRAQTWTRSSCSGFGF